MNDNNVIYQRKSIRSFNHTDVDDELLTKIVTDASQTPSWENTQPWRIYAAKGEALKEIKQLSQKNEADQMPANSDLSYTSYKQRPQSERDNILGWDQSVADAYESDDHFKDGDESQQAMSGANQNYFYAPVVVWLTTEKTASEFTIYDLGAFGQTLMLAAKQHGVDSMPAYQLVKYPDNVKKVLKIPNDQEVVMGIALGHAADDKLNNIAAKRMPVEKILTIKK